MTIHLNSHRHHSAGAFLVVFLALVVITIGGCTVYHVRRWAERIPVETPPQPPPDQYTNDNSNVTSPGTGTVSMVVLNHWWVQTDSAVDSALPPEPPATHAAAVVIVSLREQFLFLSMTNDANWVNVDLSSYVDSAGFPLAWSAPPAGIPVDVQRSTNLLDWVYFMTVFVSEGTPAIVRDTDAKPAAFYRARFK